MLKILTKSLLAVLKCQTVKFPVKMVWSCGEDERIAKQLLNGCVEGERGRGRPKD
jgi:hypothetical protein